jgi:tRNA pseudouridine38-40 synthase
VTTRSLKLTITYDGTGLVGWQRQAQGQSVQGLLEDALARLEGAPVTVHGAGRTDAGVHALGQVASVRVSCPHAIEVVQKALNATLPPDIRVIDVGEVAPDFHARFSARTKTYRYLLRDGSIASPFEHRFVWHVPEALDLDAMQAGARFLIGTHDFSAFRSAGHVPATSVRTITRSDVSVQQGWALCDPRGEPSDVATDMPASPGALVAYEVTGDGFLRHMVRAIVGTLVDVGRGRCSPDRVSALLASGRRGDAGATAPAHGLFLVRVDYH